MPSGDDRRRFDTHTRCAAAIATTHNLTQGAAEHLLDTAMAVDTRLPTVGLCLRDGLIGARDLKVIVERTELITDPDQQREVDAEIAALLRRRGSWSIPRLRDAVDAVVARTDPDAVRRRERAAREGRDFFLDPRPDAMAQVSATLVAEDAITVSGHVEDLAAKVCRNDPRTVGARRSDALFALTTGAAWSCRCPASSGGEGICDAPEFVRPASGSGATVVMHVVCGLGAIAGDTDDPGHLDGFGTVSAAHIRDLARRADTESVRVRIRPIANGTALPSTGIDPYRPSTALETMVRMRDLYCTVPGCTRRAWICDIDHVDEFDHEHPELGGTTSLEGLGLKCRFHHNWKTFTDVIDDQSVGPDGRVVRTLVVEGVEVPGPAFTGEDLFPEIADITFDPPPARTPDTPEAEPIRQRTRLAAKHARRRAERAANRRNRENREERLRIQQENDPPPF